MTCNEDYYGDVYLEPANEHVKAWRASDDYKQRPFRFEDLAGRPEPESWGPVYPKTASQAVEKWRAIARGRELTADESRSYGAAVHAWIRALNNPGARRHAIPDTDLHYCYSSARRRGQLLAAFHAQAATDRRKWAMSRDIAKAYAACPKRGDRKPRKPHYLLRNGEWRKAA
jgi:hypothetical protein